MPFEALAQPGKIGSLELKNRIVFPPVNNNFTRAGFMTDESIDFYVERARGGCGLVIIEATSVDYPRSRSVLNPAISDDKYIPGFKAIADGCHAYGAKCFVQLSHVGRQCRKSVTGMDPIAPSPIPSGASYLYPDTPKVLTIPEIKALVRLFGDAAVRSKTAGLDGVELIMGHGYLMNNFLTPASNQRADEYGGLKGGIQFCVEIIREIKQRCGEDFPIVARYNIDDFLMKNGNGPVEAALIAQELEKAGCDCISASGGMRDSDLNFADHTSGSPHGGWLHLAERIKKVVSIPVMAVKRLSAAEGDQAIRDGICDFVLFGKQLIADANFANIILENRLEDAIHCSSCCQGCYDVLWMKLPITCMVNPGLGRPVSYLKERAARRGSKTVLVVGGGPAGCETALEAARKGHRVVLVEKSDSLGGAYRLCEKTINKKEVGLVFANMEVALIKAGVEIRRGCVFTTDLVRETGAEVVVDATGSAFKPSLIEGADLPLVIDPVQALDGSRPVGKYVAVVSCGHNCTWTCRVVSRPIPEDVVNLTTTESHACSAGHAAADVAEELAMRGHTVFIITARDAFVPGMGFTNRGNLFKRYFQERVTMAGNTEVVRIVADGLICRRDGMEFKVYADTVIISDGVSPRRVVEQSELPDGVELFRAGDADTIGNAMYAFHSGYEVVDRF